MSIMFDPQETELQTQSTQFGPEDVGAKRWCDEDVMWPTNLGGIPVNSMIIYIYTHTYVQNIQVKDRVTHSAAVLTRKSFTWVSPSSKIPVKIQGTRRYEPLNWLGAYPKSLQHAKERNSFINYDKGHAPGGCWIFLRLYHDLNYPP